MSGIIHRHDHCSLRDLARVRTRPGEAGWDAMTLLKLLAQVAVSLATYLIYALLLIDGNSIIVISILPSRKGVNASKPTITSAMALPLWYGATARGQVAGIRLRLPRQLSGRRTRLSTALLRTEQENAGRLHMISS